jgi:hypothetical protein
LDWKYIGHYENIKLNLVNYSASNISVIVQRNTVETVLRLGIMPRSTLTTTAVRVRKQWPSPAKTKTNQPNTECAERSPRLSAAYLTFLSHIFHFLDQHDVRRSACAYRGYYHRPISFYRESRLNATRLTRLDPHILRLTLSLIWYMGTRQIRTVRSIVWDFTFVKPLVLARSG